MKVKRPENREGRRKGNSTRLIDYYIQLIFNNIDVGIIIHEEIGSKIQNKNASKLLFDRVLKRLKSEHNLKQIKNGKLQSILEIDKVNLIIKIKRL